MKINSFSRISSPNNEANMINVSVYKDFNHNKQIIEFYLRYNLRP